MSTIFKRLVNLANQVTGTLAIGSGGTGQTAKGAAFDALSPLSTVGDTIYYSTTGARLAGNTTLTRKVLTSTGDGVNATAPSWAQNTPSIVTFDNWVPSDGVATDTNATARTVQINNVTGLSVSTISAGVVTFTFANTGWYQINITGCMTHGNTYTEAYVSFDYGGTSTQYQNRSTFTIGGVIGSDNMGSSDFFYINVTAASQTLTVKAYARVTASGGATHTAHGCVYVLSL